MQNFSNAGYCGWGCLVDAAMKMADRPIDISPLLSDEMNFGFSFMQR